MVWTRRRLGELAVGGTLIAALLGGASALGQPANRRHAQPRAEDLRPFIADDRWRLFAIEYARSDGVPETRLVRGAPAGARVDMSWYFFVAVGNGRVVLIDCGTDAFSRPGRRDLRHRWSIERATGVQEALRRVQLSPSDVTDVLLTHFHWDHVGGLSLFPRALVHAHRGEWARVPARLRRRVDGDGRFRAIRGGTTQLWPGFRAREAGRHTAHHVLVELECAEREVVIAGDAAYLFRNLEERLPVTVTTDREGNVADVARAVQRVGAANVLPGHDPALFTRHPSAVEGVAAICR